MKFHLNRFLRRVRIHGGEFDTSARAMYREGVTSSLRADLRIVRGSTIERKQMSTKTTFKRVALVTVAALGFGVMSVAPSSAAINADSVTLSSATAAQTSAETMTATSSIVTVSFLASTALDSMSVTASLTSAPAGNTALPYLSLVDTAAAFIDSTAATPANVPGAYTRNPNTAAVVVASGTTAVTKARYKVYLGTSATAAPSVAGTYVVKLTPATVGLSGALAGSTAQTLTITVTKAASQSEVASAASTVYIAAGETTTTKVLKTDDTVIASKTLPASAPTAAASIIITQNSATDVATAGNGESITATLTGAGILAVQVDGNADATTYTTTNQGAKGRTVIAAKGQRIAVFADGTSGVGTITITTAAGLLLATKTVTFFDTKPAKVTATVKKAHILGSTTNVEKVLALVVTDSSGNAVTNAVVTAALTDSTTTIGGAATCTTYNATDKVYYCGLAGKAAKYGKANYTITATGSDAAETEVTTTADVTFASSVATKVTITGATTGTPGEIVTYTLTATTAEGTPVADTTYGKDGAGGALFASAVTSGWSTAPFLTTESWTSVSGVITTKGTLPIAGSAKGTWTLVGDGYTTSGAVDKSIGKTDIVVSTDVSNPGVDAAAAAAEEATAAANDATDAALSAAEAAEAATAMAQEAVDAVAELSASVTKLISALRAQITTLTNLVVKIQKKVKA